jgi:hypothetical protein
VDDFIKTDIDPKDFRLDKILRDPFGPAQAIDFNLKDLNTAYETIITSTQLADDVLMGDEELVNIQNSYMDSFQTEIQDELNRLLSSPIGSDRAEVTRQLKDFIRTTKKEYKREQENALKSRLKFLTDKEQVKIKVAQSKEASKPGIFPSVFNDEEAKQLSLNNDLSVFGDPNIESKERKKAFRNLWKTDGETLIRLNLIASGQMPKIKAQQPKKYYSIRSGFGGSVGKEIKRVEFTKEEREEALNSLVQLQAAKGLLGDALLQEQPVTPYGTRFDPLLLNSSQFPLVSKADILELIPLLDKNKSERESNKTFNDVVKKATKIGEEDVLEFIRNQRNLFKNGLNLID